MDALFARQPLSDLVITAAPTPAVFFRTNDSHRSWTPASTATAEHLVRARTSNDPWVVLCRPFNESNDPDGFHTYFQVLGTGSDALLVEGGGLDERGIWDWTSTWQPPDSRLVSVGPAWYRYTVHASEIQTESDALAQLWPALADGQGRLCAPTGFEWRWRHRAP
jgi:hypothetical protein